MKSTLLETTESLTLGERLLIARRRCGLKPAMVAERAFGGKRGQTVGTWELDKREPTLSNLAKLCDLYEKEGAISRRWIMMGEGPITTTSDGDAEAEVVAVVGAHTSRTPLGERES